MFPAVGLVLKIPPDLMLTEKMIDAAFEVGKATGPDILGDLHSWGEKKGDDPAVGLVFLVSLCFVGIFFISIVLFLGEHPHGLNSLHP